MTVDRVLPCVCSSAKLNDDRFDGMPVLKVCNTNRDNLQYWQAQCPKCGRGGIIEYASAYKALKAWNDMQSMLHNSVGVFKIPRCGEKMDGKFTLGSEANGCWISCAECANTGCKNRYVQEAQEDDER